MEDELESLDDDGLDGVDDARLRATGRIAAAIIALAAIAVIAGLLVIAAFL